MTGSWLLSLFFFESLFCFLHSLTFLRVNAIFLVQSENFYREGTKNTRSQDKPPHGAGGGKGQARDTNYTKLRIVQAAWQNAMADLFQHVVLTISVCHSAAFFAFAVVVGLLAIPSRIALTDYIGNNIDREREPKRVPRGSKRAREEGNDRA